MVKLVLKRTDKFYIFAPIIVSCALTFLMFINSVTFKIMSLSIDKALMITYLVFNGTLLAIVHKNTKDIQKTKKVVIGFFLGIIAYYVITFIIISITLALTPGIEKLSKNT